MLNRNFNAAAPDCVWVADITYVRTWAGFVYVAFVLDVFAQRIVGWHASSSMRTDLVMPPLRIALCEAPWVSFRGQGTAGAVTSASV
ncbi:DDE-type integrase/transposase/recombinase [Kocuria palustris]|uniref:DDE-type integrase/transposase/recombinase n=1 Tax=Kocuria palustris TaxID=71999 RepID=UPI002468F215|nr:DDE-type integrase/transposase/recombinase [Kocuria palustris]MDH5152732.1 DDE-type integrase/transposase/recombinase [Kocuria palustris]